MDKHQIMIHDRQAIDLTGVKKLGTLNESEFYLDTELGNLKITGSNLEIQNYDIDKGLLTIKGNLNSFEYVETTSISTSFFSKLFK